jgi:site-specific DNA-cytosine methylase
MIIEFHHHCVDQFSLNDTMRSIKILKDFGFKHYSTDDFFFEKSRTTAFKQIGNAVPVLMAEGIANKIKEML